jgi:hypothetical protein
MVVRSRAQVVAIRSCRVSIHSGGSSLDLDPYIKECSPESSACPSKNSDSRVLVMQLRDRPTTGELLDLAKINGRPACTTLQSTNRMTRGDQFVVT